MSYKGKYQPSYPKKYKGDHTNIIYRSLWERKFMVYCDTNTNILEWGSEEIALPYRSPLDNKVHRYFPDFYIKVRESNNKIKKYIIEVKPAKQTIEPKVKKRKTKGICMRVVNMAKIKENGRLRKNFAKTDYGNLRLLQRKNSASNE